MTQVLESPAEMARVVGLRPPRKSRRKNGRSCEDCYFWRNMLCALDLDEPCSTFRLDTPDGLVPPRQPALLLRQAEAAGLELPRDEDYGAREEPLVAGRRGRV